LIHSDEKMDKYNLSPAEIAQVRERLSLESQDAFILVVDLAGRCHDAFDMIRKRFAQLATTMPKEVRRANADGTTTYMRPMPGQARMYPETDVPPIVIDFAVSVPELIEQKIERYVSQYGLPADRAKMIAKGEQAAMFERFFVTYTNVKASAIVETVIGSVMSDAQKKASDALKKPDARPNLNQNDFEVLFKSWNEGLISSGAISSALADTVIEKISIKDAIAKYASLSETELRAIVSNVVATNPGAPMGLLIGKVMAQVKGRADGKIVAELLKKAM